MSESDFEPDPATRLHDALLAFTECIGSGLEDICSYGLTYGDSYIPFDPDPEDDCDLDDDVMCSQAWVRVAGVNLLELSTGFDGNSCISTMQVQLEVGVLRCVELADNGEAPSATTVTVAALQSMSDMKAVQCAALECDVWESIEIGQWVPFGLGDQYGGMWSFTVEI